VKNSLPARSGENKKTFFIFILALALPLFLAVVFSLSNKSLAEDPSGKLTISKVQFDGGEGKADEDFIEITNVSADETNLKGYRLAKITSSGKKYSIKSWAADTPLPAGEKYVWACSKDDFADSIGANASTSETISKDNEIDLILGSLDDGTVVDKYVWKENSSDDNSNDNSENDSFNEDTDKKSNYAEKIKINEIYPAPNTKAGEKEFIEIINSSSDDLDFSKWCLKDEVEHGKGDKGKCKKIDNMESGNDFVVFYGTFSLNNDSKGDSVYLSDSDNNFVDSQSYFSTKAGQSYSFDGSVWRWTSQSTPGAENKFDKVPKIKIQKDDPVFKDMYADFSVDVKDQNKNTKFTWDFGDGHKSYLADTKHKYDGTGTYQASLRVHDGKIDETIDFEVEVEKYKAPKIQIVGFSPNPKGSDTNNEWIEVKNNAKKKINLKGWSIATGWDTFYNHPIRKDFKIKSGKSKRLTRDICAFALANTKDKLELRGPDGKTVQKITYDHGKNSIAEDELYQKGKGGWTWIAPPTEADPKGLQKQTLGVSPGKILPAASPKANIVTPEIKQNLGKHSSAPDWENKIANRNNLANYALAVKFALADSLPRVAGAATEKIILPQQKHWLVAWLDSFWVEINSGANWVMNKL
jgi:hypothetical protein